MSSNSDVIAVLPISRMRYIERVLQSLESQTLKPKMLCVIVDKKLDPAEDKRLKELLDKLTMRVVIGKSPNDQVGSGIEERRQNISNLHNSFQDLIGHAMYGLKPEEFFEYRWVFSFEDDGVLPPNAIERLHRIAEKNYAGLVSGVELGRWGLPYVGAWAADNYESPQRITSLKSKASSVDEIDASGLYCALVRLYSYMKHQFHCDNGLGPDVNLGLSLRNEGFKNYIDWSVKVTHLTRDFDGEKEIPADSESHQVELSKNGSEWSCKVLQE